jgi:hypothetical protein
MNDKKRLNAEENHKISQGEKDGWKRGKQDAVKNLKLNGINGINPDKAIEVVRMFAEGGNEQFIRQKLGLSISDIRKALAGFNVNSIEDARTIVKKGLIAELDAAKREDQQTAASEQKVVDAKRASNLDEHKEKFSGPKPKTDDEKDQLLMERRNDAFRKNKADKIRELISQGIKPVDPDAFQIRISDIAAFKSMIPYGIGQLQRRFGGSKKDIVAEIRRLSPSTDVDLLRP